MKTEPAAIAGLETFVQDLTWRYGDPGLTAPELLGDEFQRYFDLPPSASLTWLIWLCQSRLGIEVEYRQDLPAGMKGYHHSCRDSRPLILLPADTSEFQARTTLLHELGEIIVELLVRLGPNCAFDVATTGDRWWDAFAHAVLLPREWFRQQLMETGFNLPALQQRTSLSYAGVTIRAGNVCNPDLPMFALHVELENIEAYPEVHVVKTQVWTKAWLGFAFQGKGRELFPVPRRGHIIAPTSLARAALRERRSTEYLVVAETFRGYPREAGVRLVVRCTNPRAGRIMMVGVPADYADLLRPPLCGDNGVARRVVIDELW